MKKLNLILVCISFLLSMHTFAGFQVSNYAPCEGEVVTVSLSSIDPSGICDSDPSIYETSNWYIYTIFYSTGTITLNSGPLGWYTTNTSMSFTPTPGSFTNPGLLEIRIKRFKQTIANSQWVECSEQSIFIQPKKKIVFSGPTLIEDNGLLNYSVTNVPGAAFLWTLPSGWVIVSANSNNSSITVSPTASSGTLTVTSTIPITACDWPISKPITISSCFNNGRTEFDFCILQNNWGDNLLSTEFNDPDKFPRMSGDFNGDGKEDLIGFGNTAVTVGLSSGSNFGYSTWNTGFTYGTDGSTQALYPRKIGDFNGDGKDDIIGFGHSLTYVGLSNGSSFSTTGFNPSSYFTFSQGFTNSNLPRFVGDFNGDGKDDIIGFGHNSTSVGLSTGTSFNVAGWNGGVSFSTTTGGFGDYDKYPRMIGDFNGDGKDDVIGFGHTDVGVGLSTGSSFNVSTWTNSFTYGNDGILQSTTPRGIGDFNGDGKDDVILFGNSTVTVGISTGTGFVVSTWLSNQEFTNETGWSIMTLSPTSTSGKKVILIEDMNGDGKDDLIGFAGGGTYVAYSTGSKFMCPDIDPILSLDGSSQPRMRFVGNFDNTDSQPEIVGIDDHVRVMDCNTCPTSIANATITGHYAVTPETSGSNTLNVYKYCTNTLGLDLSATICEDRYSIEIKPYDLSTGTYGSAVYQTGWIIQNAPPSINLSSIPNLQVGQLYMLIYTVGPNINTKSFGFRITGAIANFTNTPNQTRVLVTASNPTGFTIGQYCNNVTTFPVNGAASGCYDEYRYEVIEVNPPFMIPNSNAVPIQQIPVGGGWNAGPIIPHNIYMSGIVMGKIYRITLFVRRNGVTSTSNKYVERNSCTISTPKNQSITIDEGTDSGLDPASVLYPNPATNNLIVNPVGYDDEQITGEIYDAYGKLVSTATLEAGKDNTIDLLQLSPGMYLIVLKENNRIEKLSFIKQ